MAFAVLPCFFSAAGESARPRTVFVPRRSFRQSGSSADGGRPSYWQNNGLFSERAHNRGGKFGNPHILPNDRRETVKIRFVPLASRIPALRQFMMPLTIPSTSDCTISFIQRFKMAISHADNHKTYTSPPAAVCQSNDLPRGSVRALRQAFPFCDPARNPMDRLR